MNGSFKTVSSRGRWALGLMVALTGCPDEEVPLAEGIYAPLGDVLPSASAEQKATFERGLEVAKRRFTPEEGLGPKFNVTFCGSCHERPVIGGSAPRYRNFFLCGERLADGSFVTTGVNGVQPLYTLDAASRVTTDPGTNVLATRNAIPFFGVGLIAELNEDAILANSDPDDLDGDGISGRPNYDRGFVGRLGRKAQTVSVEGFIRGPLFNHAGITSNPLSEVKKAQLPVPSVADAQQTLRGIEGFGRTGRGQAAAPDEPTLDDDGAPDPELSEQDLFDLVSFSMLLAAPKPEPLTAQTEAGSAVFDEVGCAGCHVRTLEGPRGLVPLFSDLLLHDMGAELADGVPMKEATGSEFRTQPLWGVAATGPYLHDGRADTLDEAIRLHGGEAARARDAYLALAARRGQLVAFLESLGGRDQKTPGLLAPNSPVPAVGDYAGPLAALQGDDEARFVRGRELFDRDVEIASGLGPSFNGDSCRACHFEPTIGGAGPAGVNVIRHGHDDGQGGFTAPAIGTMAYRLGVAVDRRAVADLQANVFELRQTPPLYGLGLVERIPEAQILAREDPEDLDGDGVRGLAHRLPDGRLGRLGWKAGVPSVAEFARDAISNEVGLTVPEVAGHTFGFLADADDRPDPEVSAAELEDLTFFMAALAPPPRTSTDPAAEARGEALFATARCDGCHTPAMTTEDGVTVPLFSDLLLHDVQRADFVGIADGMASTRHFRTSPLWGLGQTAPYMHDGRAYTIEEAIARHEAEADASRAAFEQLSGEERAELLAFLRSL